MKSHTEKHKVKLNPCKYCGETEVEIVYNRFNNQEHCVAQCKCGAYVQRYCTNPLLAPELEKLLLQFGTMVILANRCEYETIVLVGLEREKNMRTLNLIR